MVFLYRRQSHLLLRGGELHLLKPDMEILQALVLKGLPMGVQMIVLSVAAMMMISLVNQYGSMTTAAYGAASQIWSYVQMPAMALSAAVSSMSAQNVGAKRWDRIAQIAGKGVLIGLAITGGVVVAIYGLGDHVLGLFLPPHSAALPIARHIDFIVLWAFVLFSVTFTLFGIVRSTGAVWAPLGVLVISMWLIRVPFALALTPHFGAEAIWWSFPLGTITSASLAGLYYLYGGWRKAHFVEAATPAPAGA
jgi:Na+-driven multidrug efflux pump